MLNSLVETSLVLLAVASPVSYWYYKYVYKTDKMLDRTLKDRRLLDEYLWPLENNFQKLTGRKPIRPAFSDRRELQTYVFTLKKETYKARF